MRQLVARVALVALAAATLALSACEGVRLPGLASYDQVKAVRDDHDKAIASLTQSTGEQLTAVRTDLGAAVAKARSDEDAALAQLRKDLDAQKAAGQDAYQEAVAHGKSDVEALALKTQAETALAQKTAADAMAASKTNADAAVAAAVTQTTDAVKKMTDAATASATDAQTKAKAANDNSTSPVGAALVGLGSIALSTLMAYLGLRKHDAAPFIGSDGQAIPEGQLVDSALAILKANGPQPGSRV